MLGENQCLFIFKKSLLSTAPITKLLKKKITKIANKKCNKIAFSNNIETKNYF